MQCLFSENSTLVSSTWKTLKTRSVLVNKFHSWLKYGFFPFNYLWKRTTISYTIFFSIWRNIYHPHRQEPNKNRNGFWKLMAFGSIWFPIYSNPLKSHTASSDTNSVDEFQFLWQHSKLYWLQLNTRFDKWLPLFRAFEFSHKRAEEWDLNPFW